MVSSKQKQKSPILLFLLFLVSRLTVCEELERSSCGDVLFHGMLPSPSLPRPSLDDNSQNETFSEQLSLAPAGCYSCNNNV